jgi:branched-chain amino acid aminotransferase
VIDGALHTPVPDCFLDGITRRTVIDLARARGLIVIERTIPPADLSRATEMFLTGTAAEVTPVASLDAHSFSVGTITRTLIDDYEAIVRGRYVRPALAAE